MSDICKSCKGAGSIQTKTGMYVCPACDGTCWETGYSQEQLDAAVAKARDEEREAIQHEYADMWGIAHAALNRLCAALQNRVNLDNLFEVTTQCRAIVAAQLFQDEAIRARKVQGR